MANEHGKDSHGGKVSDTVAMVVLAAIFGLAIIFGLFKACEESEGSKKCEEGTVSIARPFNQAVVNLLEPNGVVLTKTVVKASANSSSSLTQPVSQTVVVTPNTLATSDDRVRVRITAYRAVPEETDDTPCIGADTTDLCKRREQGELLCATTWKRDHDGDIIDFVALGTKVKIPGIGICTVADRTSQKWQEPRLDIFCGPDPEKTCVYKVSSILAGSNQFITLSKVKLERGMVKQKKRAS